MGLKGVEAEHETSFLWKETRICDTTPKMRGVDFWSNLEEDPKHRGHASHTQNY